MGGWIGNSNKQCLLVFTVVLHTGSGIGDTANNVTLANEA